MVVMASDKYPNLNWGSGWNATPPMVPMKEAFETVGENIASLPPELRERLGEVAGDGGVDGLLLRLNEAVREQVETDSSKDGAELRGIIDTVLAESDVSGNKKMLIRAHVMRVLSRLPVNQER